jgi:phage shock protein A
MASKEQVVLVGSIMNLAKFNPDKPLVTLEDAMARHRKGYMVTKPQLTALLDGFEMMATSWSIWEAKHEALQVFAKWAGTSKGLSDFLEDKKTWEENNVKRLDRDITELKARAEAMEQRKKKAAEALEQKKKKAQSSNRLNEAAQNLRESGLSPWVVPWPNKAQE